LARCIVFAGKRRESIFPDCAGGREGGTGRREGSETAEQEARFPAEASNQILLMKWRNVMEPTGSEKRGIHAPFS